MTLSQQAVEQVFREESGRILATLIRVLGDFDAAEEAMQDAVATALERWPVDGVPTNPSAWITTTARHKAIDRLRRERSRSQREADAGPHQQQAADEIDMLERRLDCPVDDDRLRLMFTCCHPALNQDAQVTLTLSTLGGLKTREIARAFLVPLSTLAQRLVRAKNKIKAANIPYRVPPDHLLPQRVPAVLAVVYLIFNEGYSASGGDNLIRQDLCTEAIRLGRILVKLMPNEAEALGLLSLMLLSDSRRDARTSGSGETILLGDQDRSRWDHQQASQGRELLADALRMRRPGSYQLQAAIAALHSEAETPEATDWEQIVALYDALLRIHPSPVVALNHAVAVAMVAGPQRGLDLVEKISNGGSLRRYLFFHSTRADLLRQLGRFKDAIAAYCRALKLAGNAAEQEFLKRRLAECRRE